MLALIASVGAFTSGLQGAITVHIDMDTTTDGIQATREAIQGDTFEVGIVMDIDGDGLSSYGFSVTFDELELSLNSFSEIAPAGLATLIPGVDAIDLGDATTIVGESATQLSSFDGFTFAMGPSDTSVLVGTLEFTVLNPNDNNVPDIAPGFFSLTDGAFDNTLPIGADLVPTATLNPGSIIPEPSSAALALLAGSLLAFRRSRR